MDPMMVDMPFHPHPLKPVKMDSEECGLCKETIMGLITDGYRCGVCNLTFHVNCEEPDIIHPSHSLHPLKFCKGEPPAYTDGKCRLCGNELTGEFDIFFHCSTCNFSIDVSCMDHPPAHYIHDQNIHDHQLTLMPKFISFTCTICGLNGDRSPYVCLSCDFIVHNDCSEYFSKFSHWLVSNGFPWVININRHDHRVYRTSLIGIVDSVCGICRKKMDWSCGGYACKRCPSSVFHTKCATRKHVWNGKEMKDEPEEDEETQSFEVIDENTIQHVSHPEEEHNLRLDKSGIFIEERVCQACAYPIYHYSFYICMSCNFILHEACAYLPLWKRIPLALERSNYIYKRGLFECEACGFMTSGFGYKAQQDKFVLRCITSTRPFDVRCATVTDPFVHKSHSHPLYYTTPEGVCSVCNEEAEHVLRCVEENLLGFRGSKTCSL